MGRILFFAVFLLLLSSVSESISCHHPILPIHELAADAVPADQPAVILPDTRDLAFKKITPFQVDRLHRLFLNEYQAEFPESRKQLQMLAVASRCFLNSRPDAYTGFFYLQFDRSDDAPGSFC
jgi:hypothetical protein